MTNKWTRILKNKSFQLKANIDWNNVSKAVDIEGREYTITKLPDGRIHTEGDGKSLNVSLSFAVGLLDIYDKEGNKISSMKDYQ